MAVCLVRRTGSLSSRVLSYADKLEGLCIL